MLFRAIPFLVLVAAVLLVCFFRSSAVVRGVAIFGILAVTTYPFLGVLPEIEWVFDLVGERMRG